MVEINNQGILHLYYLIWVYWVYQLSNMRDELQLNNQYTLDMSKFINKIIQYSISK